jgi:hypothetical protein
MFRRQQNDHMHELGPGKRLSHLQKDIQFCWSQVNLFYWDSSDRYLIPTAGAVLIVRLPGFLEYLLDDKEVSVGCRRRVLLVNIRAVLLDFLFGDIEEGLITEIP